MHIYLLGVHFQLSLRFKLGKGPQVRGHAAAQPLVASHDFIVARYHRCPLFFLLQRTPQHPFFFQESAPNHGLHYGKSRAISFHWGTGRLFRSELRALNGTSA